MVYILTCKKLIGLLLIRASQGVLISAGITTLILLAVLFAWAFLVSVSLSRLREASRYELSIYKYFDFRNIAMLTQNNLNTVAIVENTSKFSNGIKRKKKWL